MHRMVRAVVSTSVAVLGITLVLAPAAAQDADSLRRELEQLRRQFESVQQDYRKAIETLRERLERLETQPARAATSPPAAPMISAPAAPAPVPIDPAPAQPSLIDFLRPRAPFALTPRTGTGQLLFDLGVVGDFIGNITQDNIAKARAGTFAGRENRFFPREVELLLFGQIDPYARGEVRLEAAEEFEDGERVTEVRLAEANLTLLTLPFGTQAKLGLMRNRFGLLNQLHREGLPQPDQPNVITRFLGEEGLRESGLELTWVPNLPVYLEGLVGVFNGDNEDAFGRGSLKSPLITGRLRTFLELGRFGAVQVGVSGAGGQTAERRRQIFAGYDVKYKLVPDGWRHPLFTLASEGIYSNRRVTSSGEFEVDVDTDDDGIPDSTATETRFSRRTRERFGWYAYGEVQPTRRWLGGVRYDSTQFLEAPGREWAVEPYLAFLPSDFLRFRLAYKHTERDRRAPFSANDATARIVDEFLFQVTFFLGAHLPHPF
jgi:hypothetical protein